MPIKIEYNDVYDEWDIDSRDPLWLHTAAATREKAISKARKLNETGEQIKIKGPRMNTFKSV